jgi:GT2 family glycosyltransferase
MASVCVEVAVRDDRRAVDAVRSLAGQSRRPDRILVAAAPESPPDLLDAIRTAAGAVPIEVARFPGGVVDARAGALALVREDLLAFLDADERAPPGWLALLVEPLERGLAAFSGGPTRPTRAPVGSIERYYDLLEESIYADLVPGNVVYVPLQNSAWSTPLLRSLGFDARIPFAEDHDLATRALAAGAVGRFVPEAWVYHDKSTEKSLGRWARKRYRYLVAMAMSLLKNGQLRGRLAERRRPVPHPLRYLEATMKPFALLDASVRWRRRRRLPSG